MSRTARTNRAAAEFGNFHHATQWTTDAKAAVRMSQRRARMGATDRVNADSLIMSGAPDELLGRRRIHGPGACGGLRPGEGFSGRRGTGRPRSADSDDRLSGRALDLGLRD